jgi:hypothetical protein
MLVYILYVIENEIMCGLCFNLMFIIMVCLNIEFLELELNSNSIYKFRGKKMCLGVEFLD